MERNWETNCVELNYAWHECEDGIYHAFEATDPQKLGDADEMAHKLADLLDTNPDDCRFGWNSMYVQIPESVIERIRAEERAKIVAEVENEFDRRIQNIKETLSFRRKQSEVSMRAMMSVDNSHRNMSDLMTSGGFDAMVNQAKGDLVRLRTVEAEFESAAVLKKYITEKIKK